MMFSRRSASGRKARLSLGLSGVLSMICVSSGVQAATHANAPLTLTQEGWGSPEQVTPTNLQCERQLNIQVKYTYVPRLGYETKLQTQFAAGMVPDVFAAPPEEVAYYGSKGQALDLLPYFKQLRIPYNDVLPQGQFWADGKPGTKLWAVSTDGQAIYLFYNKDVFKQAGVAAPPSDAAHAWTWPQFVATANKLTIDRNGRHPDNAGFDARHIQRYGVNIPFWYAPLLPLIQSNGGSDFDPAGKRFTLNQPAAAHVVQAVADLSLKDHVMPTPSQFTSGAGSLTLASGRLGMQIDGNWAVYFNTHPAQTFKWGIGVLPRFKQYKGFYFAGSASVISPKTTHPKEAILFNNCLSHGNASLLNYRSGIDLPMTRGLLYGDGVKSWSTTSYHPANFQSVVIDTIQYAQTPPLNYVTQFGPTWTNILTPALNRIQAGEPAQTVLNGVKPQVDALLAR